MVGHRRRPVLVLGRLRPQLRGLALWTELGRHLPGSGITPSPAKRITEEVRGRNLVPSWAGQRVRAA